jgi:hypothetical protein
VKTPRLLNLALNFEACGGADAKNSRKIISRAAIRKLRSSFRTVCLIFATRKREGTSSNRTPDLLAGCYDVRTSHPTDMTSGPRSGAGGLFIENQSSGAAIRGSRW